MRCIATNCPYEDSCYRHDIIKSHSNVYDFSYYCNIDSGFDYFIPNIKKENKNNNCNIISREVR